MNREPNSENPVKTNDIPVVTKSNSTASENEQEAGVVRNASKQEDTEKIEEAPNMGNNKGSFYHHFKNKLKLGESESLKNKMLGFIQEVQNDKHKTKNLVEIVQNFINDFEISVQETWKETEELKADNGEAIEGIITKVLYNKLISLYSIEKDHKMEMLLKTFEFIELKHLECRDEVIISASYDHALKHIEKIDTYKTPRDKLISIINCCKIVSGMVNQQSKNARNVSGADDFLPVLIYIVLKARPKNCLSNINFIKDFRSPIRMRGEDEYYLTAYESALQFIETLSQGQLKIDKDEYQKLYDKYSKMAIKESFNYEEDDQAADDSLRPEQSKKTKVLATTDRAEQEMTEIGNALNAHIIKSKIQEISDTASMVEGKKLKLVNREWVNISVAEISDLYLEYRQLISGMQEIKKRSEDLLKHISEHETGKEKKDKKPVGKKYFGLF